MEQALSIPELEASFIEDLRQLSDWFLQYEYLLAISADMPHIPEAERAEAARVPGCQSAVWLLLDYTGGPDGVVRVRIDSDALILRGILSIVYALLDDRTPEEIIGYTPRFIEETNIKGQISTDRFHGIQTVIQAIQDFSHEHR